MQNFGRFKLETDFRTYGKQITRENLYGLPYSVEEIYGIHPAGKYQNTRKIYQQMYQIYSKFQNLPVHPDKIIVEDSNSGYELIPKDKIKPCISA